MLKYFSLEELPRACCGTQGRRYAVSRPPGCSAPTGCAQLRQSNCSAAQGQHPCCQAAARNVKSQYWVAFNSYWAETDRLYNKRIQKWIGCFFLQQIEVSKSNGQVQILFSLEFPPSALFLAAMETSAVGEFMLPIPCFQINCTNNCNLIDKGGT